MQLIGPWRNAGEGALASLCALVAMATMSAGALLLMDASSVGSLWSLTMAVTAMAVGGSVSSTAETSTETGDMGGMGGLAGLFGGGGGMAPSMSGAAEAVPLGVTLVGAVVLWVGFSWRFRQAKQPRITAGALAARVCGAMSAALFTLLIVAGLAHGTAQLPASAMQGMPGLGGSTSSGGGGSPFGDLMGGGGSPFGDLLGGEGSPFGDLLGGGASSQPALTYQVSAAPAVFGAVLWVAVVLGVGCLVSRRVWLPLGGALERLRPGWAPSLSAVVRTVVVLAVVPLVVLAIIGGAVGGRAGTAAGAALLLFPNLLAVLLSLGVGSAWTAAVHSVQSDTSSNPLAGLMGGMGGMTGAGGTQQPDRTEHLGSLSVGGWPLWLVAFLLTGLILLGCAYRAARVTHPGYMKPLHPYRGPLARHLGMAERFGVVTAAVLGASAWLAGLSGKFAISMFGSEMGGMQAQLEGSVLRTVVLGLLVGGLVGFAGSLLADVRGRQRVA